MSKQPPPSGRNTQAGTRAPRSAVSTASRTRGAQAAPSTDRRRLDRRETWILAMVAALTVAALALVVVLNRDEDAGGAAPAAAEFGHVHGLGIDPADGALYAATHYGLYKLTDDGSPELVGDRVQDFMGFTVVGPNHFLASGHPGIGDPGPSSVGLIESTDAGLSWHTKSLAGEADFHALEASGDQVYGVNAMTGQFLAGSDGENWQQLSTLPMVDFAVDPDDVSQVVATTENGPAISDDGGRTFGALGEAPVLVFVDWDERGTLVGVTPNGEVYVSKDTGSSWQAVGDIGGPPEALHVEDATIYAVTDSQVLVSSDGGATFSRYGT